MNCNEWEERIALYAGGDLAPTEAQAVEGHVAECAGCQVLLSGLRQNLELLREANAEPLEEAHFTAVRARVLSEIGQRRGYGWSWAWMSAMAAALVLVLVALWPRPTESLRLPIPQPPAPAIAKVEPTPVPAPPRARRPHRAQLVQARPPAQPLGVVKLLTSDPDIVIYWITETKGE